MITEDELIGVADVIRDYIDNESEPVDEQRIDGVLDFDRAGCIIIKGKLWQDFVSGCDRDGEGLGAGPWCEQTGQTVDLDRIELIRDDEAEPVNLTGEELHTIEKWLNY